MSASDVLPNARRAWAGEWSLREEDGAVVRFGYTLMTEQSGPRDLVRRPDRLRTLAK
ncbi:hypothetical protein GCM10010170_000670 [Dactylosporangium salmoneum]|uniref:Uncharacterized protein n=1 Tax=Dactylosporangium salmoneum TaxID=53361 RepID=A0ABN3FBS4_9ACTN